ncbi:MAG: SDR family oxidoreductase [Ornithinimicrobium sp.]
MNTDQLAFDNPVDRHPTISPPQQDQDMPGLDAELTPRADIGEHSYRGTGRLTGRKALVTGGDSGIGAAVAIAFAREGADVAINYLPAEEEDAERIVGLVLAEGRLGVGIPGDITDSTFCADLVDGAVERLGGLDILVNNAAKQVTVPRLEELDDEQFDRTMKTNLYAMFWITKAALPRMPAGAAIIQTSSKQGYGPSDHLLDYATSKAAMTAFTKGLAKQCAPDGIRVNAVAPGPVWTPLQVVEGQPKESLPEFGFQTPLGRAAMPVELAPAFVFLASSESSYVVGETLHVNGGLDSP